MYAIRSYYENDYPLAFMLIDDGHMEALFVDPARRGTGRVTSGSISSRGGSPFSSRTASSRSWV